MATTEDYKEIIEKQAELIKKQTLENDELRGEIIRLNNQIKEVVRCLKILGFND